MVAPRAQAQARGFLLLLLVLGHEAQLVGAKIADVPKNGTLGDDGRAEEARLKAFEEPAEVVTQLALQGGAPSRSLALAANWAWAAGTELTFKHQHHLDGTLSFTSTDTVTLVASLLYNEMMIKGPTGTQYSPDHDNAVAKLVSDDADRNKCADPLFDVPVGEYRNGAQWVQGIMGSLGPQALTVESATELSVSLVTIVFMWGGRYKLCYSPEGNFVPDSDVENMGPVDLKILGVRSPCDHGRTDGCIREERWECSFAYKGEPSPDCVFSFKADGGRSGWSVETGDQSKMTWSEVYGADTLSGGSVQSTDPKYCAAAAASESNLFDTSQVGTRLVADTATSAVMPPVVAARTAPFTVAACYCPSYDYNTGQPCNDGSGSTACCDLYYDFIQQVGVLYYWTVRICNYDNYQSCTTPYMRVLPQQKFVLRVECPPGGGCLSSENNRIKYIDATENNDRPTWDRINGCKTTTLRPDSVVWPTSEELNGGARMDYKVWRTQQVKINRSLRRKMDVCFCNENCVDTNNYFKVGQVQTANNFAYASKIGPASAAIKTLKYVEYSGSVTLFGGIYTDAASTTADPYDSNEFSNKALVNIMSYDREQMYGVGINRVSLETHFSFHRNMPDDFQDTMDGECQRERYSATLVQGPEHQQAAKTYIAKVPGTENTISQYQSFSGENQDQTMQIKLAGVVAICYCAMVNEQNECEDPADWLYTGRLTIQGPRGGQEWIFPTHIVVGLSVMGWGLGASDRLRVIPASSTCQDNANNPTGAQSFKVDCPAPDGTGCATAQTNENIAVNALTASSSGLYITGVQTQPTHTELTFNNAITDTLMSDDMITIDLERVMVGGNLPAAMTPPQLFEAYKFTGQYQFQDDTSKTYDVAHRVSQVTISNNVQTSKLSIPVGWPLASAPSFSFTNNQGYWTRRNKVTTNVEIKGKEAASNLKVCWGVEVSGTATYYSQAGQITFQDPPQMMSAKVALTSKQRDAIAPVVIAIETGAQRSEYAGATGKTQLVLRFLDISVDNGKLLPREAGDIPPTGSPPAALQDTAEVLPAESRQWLCGRLFNELWSTHEEGFPLPHGCYYGRKYRDDPEGGDTKFYREVVIVFSERNGLRQNTQYQMVMNAEAKVVLANERVVDIYAMCAEETGCLRPYMVFEKGQATSSIATEAAAGPSDAAWGENGFFIQRGDAIFNVLSLAGLESSQNILQARLTGQDGARSIKREAIIRAYLYPLTQWSVGSAACAAECIKHHASNKQCTGPVGCVPEEVVAGSNRKNIIRITLPSEMDDITSSTTHTVKITGLTLPIAGFFPSRVGAQLTKDDDTLPAFTSSTGMIWKSPELGQTTGRLVLEGRTGYGPRPFAGETLPNTLYVRLQIGATIWNVGEQTAASFTLTLPRGYTCSVPDGGVPPATMPVFFQDYPVDGYPDNNRGLLSVHPEDGDWSRSAQNVCEFHFNPFNAMYAGQVAYVKLTVTNPAEPLSKFADSNLWKLKLSSKGYNALALAPYDMMEVPFITLSEEATLNDNGPNPVRYWASNAAVVSTLTREVIQPEDFTRSCCSPAFDQRMTQQYLRIFFRTVRNVGQGGYVIIDAPDGFDFQQSCSARDLHERYYAFVGTQEHQLTTLKSMGACVGSRYPVTAGTYNRARIQVQGYIAGEYYYGLEVRVTHPITYSPQQEEEWYIWTEDHMMYPIEGSYSTVKFNPLQADSKSYGLYDNEADGVNIYIDSMRPKNISTVDAGVTVYPIEFPIATETSLRITAPVGFVWDTNVDNFIRRSNFSTIDFPVPTFINGVSNVLIWESFTFNERIKYGFIAKIAIPNYNPRTSSNSFFIEFGFREQEINRRLMASVLPAPSVASLINCEVGYASNLVSYADNRMEFRLETITTLIQGDGIVIVGDQNTRGFTFDGVCNPVMLPDSPPLTGVLCSYVRDRASQPQITLKVLQGQSLQPGYYKFELKVSNPDTRILTAGIWTFGSYREVDTYPSSRQNIVDQELATPGFVVQNSMPDAFLRTITLAQRADTNRNDRPGQANQLIFQFRLGTTPDLRKTMTLQGPRGFFFDQDCLPGLFTSANEVFGDNTEGSWPPDLTKWAAGYAPVGCEGQENLVKIDVPTGLLRNNQYVFRIAVRMNPMVTPDWNLWSISFNSESSAPFLGFTVWTFTGLETPLPVSYAKSPTGANVVLTENPVQLEFSPFNTVPAPAVSESRGGLLRVTAPPGFAFVSSNGECTVDLFETGMMASTIFTKQYTNSNGLLVGDYMCWVDQTGAKLNLVLVGDRSIQGLANGQGRAYTMVVRVYNPPSTSAAGTWELDSFASHTAEISDALDTTLITGFPINDVLVTFIVTNTLDVRRGNVPVNDVDVTLRFPDAIKDDDEIVVRGPMGYNLVGDAETSTCNDLRYPGNPAGPFPTTGMPACACEVGLNCTIVWRVRENRDPAYPQNEDIRFKIATANPSQTPLLTQDYWTVVHTRGNVIKSSHVARSWGINPQLEPVDVQITGTYLAAGSISDITFTMTPVSDAGVIKIEALLPTEFDFSTATVDPRFDIILQEGPTIVVRLQASPLRSGQEFELRINSVKLGRGGGQTRWNLYTYGDENMQQKLDERLQFEGGFRLPGKIIVLDPQLESQYREFRDMFPVKSLFQPRVNEDASAEFRISLSQAVHAQQVLKITCQGPQGDSPYTLRQTPFVIVGIGQIQVSTVLDQFGALLVTLLPGRPPAEVALNRDTPYTITMRVFPRSGTNTWRFDTMDNAGFTNTNDGETQGFSPVERMGLTVQTQRSPPKAIIEVTLNVQPGTANVRELLIIAPPGFTFDERTAGCGDMCTPGNSLEGRRTATIASPTGEPLTQFTGLRIRVMTPEQTPLGMGSEGITWFIEGRGQGAGTTTGWGEGSGFMVTQMTGSSVSYAGVSNLMATQITFTFSVDVDAGSSVSVVPPPGYQLTCSMEGSLKQISLPGGLPNCIDDPLQLQLLQPLTVGLYAFAVTVDLPDQTPEENTFNIIIRDQDNNVVDAAYGIQGQELHPIGVGLPTLGWSSANPGQPTTVTVGVTFTRDTILVKAVLITLPDLFQHDVQIPIDVQNVNKRFPVAAGMDWADTSEPNRIKIFLDDSDDSTNVPPDTYRFNFPVLMPPEVPRNNIWFASLCSDRSCTQPGDRYVLVSFPIAGFRIGELAPEGVRVSANGSRRREQLSLVVGFLLSLFALLTLAA